MPGFFVGSELGAIVIGIEANAALVLKSACRDEVPEIEFDDVDGGEVELVAGVRADAGDDAAAVSARFAARGGLDLDAVEMATVLDREVVWGSITPGFGDAKAEFGGTPEKTNLCPLAAELGMLNSDTVIHEA